MAKFARCENQSCGKESELRGPMEFDPDGWIAATERVPLTDDRRYLACSPLCMSALMAKRAREIETARIHADVEAQGSDPRR